MSVRLTKALQLITDYTQSQEDAFAQQLLLDSHDVVIYNTDLNAVRYWNGSVFVSTPTYGDMMKTDNLSGLSNYTTARSNLGLGTFATISSLAFGSLTSIPTTLGGYGITDAVPSSRTINGSALSSNITITTITGNAGSATVLQTARTINGVSFDGSGNITIAAAAGTLTGITLASGVTASSLTSFGAGAITNLLPSQIGNTGKYLTTDGSNVSWGSPSGSGDMVLASVQTVTGNKTFNPGVLIHAAGTASFGAETFILTSAALLTSAIAGVGEVDANGIRYWTHATSERSVVDSEQFISLTGAYTLTSQTAAQKLFNSSTNGALTVSSSKSYYFECFFSLTSMSSTSGAFGFSFGGTATFTSQTWQSSATKSTLATASAPLISFNTAANVAISAANTTTTGHARIWGIVRINAGGTLIPQVSLGVASAAIVGVNSYFRIWPVGTNSVTNVGNWS
jgi:hypothetical protein